MKRHWIVGDVQGCRTELERLLEHGRFDPAHDRLVLLGDLVNRGPDSAGVLRLARSLEAEAVLGNHDVRLLRVAQGLLPQRPQDTANAVLEASDRSLLLEYLSRQPLVRSYGSLLCVHAGFHPLWSDPLAQLSGLDPLVESPELSFAISVRSCDASGRRPRPDPGTPVPGFRPWYQFWQEKPGETRTVAFGHWAQHGLVWQPRVRGLDTGCVWGGQLSAWIPQEDRLLQVPAAVR